MIRVPGAPPRHGRRALQLAASLAVTAAVLAPAQAHGQHRGLQVDVEAREIRVQAVARPAAFVAGLPPDHQYHALVYEGGGAAGKSLFVTAVPDSAVARALRELGAEDGGGVPLAAWTLRWVPLLPQPAARVQGTRLDVRVRWDGGDPVPFSELLEDPGGQGVEMRFGGNEAHDEHWDSGCIMCLFSCPGGVISNARYSIRDHQRGATLFAPSERMPPEGTPVEFIFSFPNEQGPPFP
jgi:hypothetical protein